MEHWKIIEHSFSKEVAAKVKLTRIKLPPDLTVTVTVELDKEPLEMLEKDPVWAHSLTEIAKAKSDKAIADLVHLVGLFDRNLANTSDPKAAETSVKELTDQLKVRLNTVGQEMVAETNKLIEGHKKRKKELTKFQLKSTFKIVVSSLAIAGTGAMAAASHGVLTPFAGVAMARSTIVIGQECFKLASNCNIMAKAVTKELGILKTLIGEKSKVRGTAVETGLGILSGLSGMETPSVKNCKSRIELHKLNISKLEQESKKLAGTIDQVVKTAEDWEKKAKEAVRTMPGDKVGKVRAKMDAAQKALEKLLGAIEKVNGSIGDAWKNQARFEAAIANLSQNVAAWTKFVDVAVGGLTDVALGVGDASSAIESAVSVFIAVSADAVMAAAA